MTITKVYCDHCSKELSEDKERISLLIPKPNGIDLPRATYVLCENCAEDFRKFLLCTEDKIKNAETIL